MICKECKNEMILDDEDFRFKGNTNKYWICENCHTSCTEEIRFNQSYKEHWYNEDKNIDCTIKHDIAIKR